MKNLLRLAAWFCAVFLAGSTISSPARAQAGAGKIVFESWEATGTSSVSRSRIGIMNADGSSAVSLTNTANSKFDDWNPSFNRSGSQIVFLSDRTGTDEVYVMNADGTNQVRLTKNSSSKQTLAISEPQFSPDGAKIAFSAIPVNVANATWEIYIMNADGSGLSKLTTSVPGTGGSLSEIFTSDGNRILFARGLAGLGFDLCEMNLDGTGISVLTSLAAGSWSNPSISPDGSKIVLGLNGSLVLMNADGTNQSVIYNTGFSGSPIFNLDGTKIAFATGVGDTEETFTMNLDGSELTQVTFGPGVSPPSSIEANGPGGWAPGSVGFPGLASLTLHPATVLPGSPSQGTVSLSMTAPAGGAIIALSSSSPFAAVPPTVTIPAGATSAVFPILTTSVPALTAVTITVSFDGVNQTATLRINPTPSLDTVGVTQAEYTVSQKQLQVQATSTSASATLNVYVSSTGALIGAMTNAGGGKYQIKTTWPVNPLNVTVKSSLGGSASLNVTAK